MEDRRDALVFPNSYCEAPWSSSKGMSRILALKFPKFGLSNPLSWTRVLGALPYLEGISVTATGAFHRLQCICTHWTVPHARDGSLRACSPVCEESQKGWQSLNMWKESLLSHIQTLPFLVTRPTTSDHTTSWNCLVELPRFTPITTWCNFDRFCYGKHNPLHEIRK